MNYGLPYKGSKNKIAQDIIEVLPANETLVDLFAGGCAITHCAMLSNKWRKFIINDVDTQILDLFVNAINGKYRNEKRVITKEDFEQLKDTDPYVASCWSFGNDCKGYLWNNDTAGAKVLACKMVLADTWQERLKYYRAFVLYLQGIKAELKRRIENKERLRAEYGDIQENVRLQLIKYLDESGKSRADIDRMLGTNGMAGHYFGKSQWEFPTQEKYEIIRQNCPNFPPYDYWGERLESLQSLERLERLESLESLQSLESLERLQSLESLERLQSLEKIGTDYRNVKIPPNSTVYCDIPYEGTNTYRNGFNHGEFWQWARNQSFPVYVSEYNAPEDFKEIWSKEKTIKYSRVKVTKIIEKLFVYEKFADMAKNENQNEFYQMEMF